MQKIIMCLSRSFGSSIFFQFRYFIPFLFKNFQILDKYFFSLSYLKRQLSEKRMKEPRKNFYRLIFEVSFILSPAQKSSMTGGLLMKSYLLSSRVNQKLLTSTRTLISFSRFCAQLGCLTCLLIINGVPQFSS